MQFGDDLALGVLAHVARSVLRGDDPDLARAAAHEGLDYLERIRGAVDGGQFVLRRFGAGRGPGLILLRGHRYRGGAESASRRGKRA